MKHIAAVLLLALLPFQARAQVVMTELHPNPDPEPDADNEWVEIFNAGEMAVDLTGWAIEDDATIDDALIRRRIPEDFDANYGTSPILQPGEFRVVRGTGATWGQPYLNNGGDTVYLVSDRTGNLGSVVHSVVYPSTVPGDCWANLPDTAMPPNFDWRSCTPGQSNCAADVVSPAAVTDLMASTGAYAGEVDLAWTCVGNDGNSGVALRQIVKYNTVPITALNFDASTDAFNEPLPAAAGTPQAMTVFGLVPGQTYWFAMKTQDCQNTSALSTSVPQAQAGTTPLPYADHTVGLQIYFGNLHSHTGYSDGQSTPTVAYAYARTQAQTPLDFLAVTDHNHGGAGSMTPALYQQGLSEAAAATVDGQFVALYGQEWGFFEAGHVNVFESPVLFGWEPGNYDVFVAQDDYAGLYAAIAANPSPWGPLASFNHPDPQGGDFDGFAFTAAGAEVLRGIALVSGPYNSTATDESDVGNTNFDGQYLTALRKGFFVAPVGDQDNHEANWGASTETRTAILATGLSKSELLAGLAARRSYATQDHNVQVAMQVNGWPMGSRIAAAVGGGVDFDIALEDPDVETTQRFELFRGTPGAGDATVIATAEDVERFVYRDEESPSPGEGAVRVYFLRITQTDNQRIWTAPVEVTFSTAVDVAELAGPPAMGGRLQGATPNPFNPGTRLRFELLGAGMRPVSLRIFDVRGRLVRTLVHEDLDAGPHGVSWNGTSDDGVSLASGVYVARLRAPGVDARTRLVLLH